MAHKKFPDNVDVDKAWELGYVPEDTSKWQDIIKEKEEKRWTDKECEMVRLYNASHHSLYNFNKRYSGDLHDETIERISYMFSQYFSTKDSEKTPYDVISKFFHNYKTLPARWQQLPSTFRFRGGVVYMDHPYKLKRLPDDANELRELGAYMMSIFLKVDESELLKYMENVDKERDLKNISLNINKKTRQEIEAKLKENQAKLDDAEDEYDIDGYRTFQSTVDKINDFRKKVKKDETTLDFQNRLKKFEDLEFRKDPTEEQVEQYKKDRLKNIKVQNKIKK